MKLLFALPRWDRRSGGVRGMHYMCRLLKLAGYEVQPTINLCEYDREMNCSSQVDADAIAIYPDCFGPINPVGAQRVVRFMCYYASCTQRDFWGGAPIPAGECVVLYNEALRGDVLGHCAAPMPRDNVIAFPAIEPGLFYPEAKTNEALLYVGKCDRPLMPPPIVTQRIERRSLESIEQLAALIRRTAAVYSQDSISLLNAEAVIGGAKVYLASPQGKWEKWQPEVPPHAQIMNERQDLWHAHRLVRIIREFFNV